MQKLDDIPSERVVLSELKDFQRRTVNYVFHRLFHRSDPARRFLIADEVWLGKTLVAKGVIAKAVHQLKEATKRIDIVYVCSNQAIAKQNINRISLMDLEESEIPRRLTLLPLHLKNLNKLRSLDLRGTPIRDSSLQHIRHLKSLRRLTVKGAGLSAAALDGLEADLPDCSIAR